MFDAILCCSLAKALVIMAENTIKRDINFQCSGFIIKGCLVAQWLKQWSHIK